MEQFRHRINLFFRSIGIHDASNTLDSFISRHLGHLSGSLGEALV